MTEPTRLLDEGSNDLRALLAAGREELPDEARMHAIALALGALGGGLGGAGAAGAGGAAGAVKATSGAAAGAKAGAAAIATKGASLALVTKVVAGALVVAGGASSVVYATRSTSPPRAPTTIVAPSASGPVAAATPAAPAEAAEAPPTPSAEEIAVPSPRSPSAPTRVDPVEEQRLVGLAVAAKSAAPERALAICNEHARRFPAGELTQEREVIAIEALVALDRRAEAVARAARFERKFPGSAHLRRIQTIVGQ